MTIYIMMVEGSIELYRLIIHLMVVASYNLHFSSESYSCNNLKTNVFYY